LEVAHVRQVSARYFETMGAPLLRGRMFSEEDKMNSPLVLVINETMAQKFFPGENPLGHRLTLGDGEGRGEIVGVVRDTKPLGLDQPTPPEVFRSHTQTCDWYLSLVVRTSTAPEAMLGAIRLELKTLDTDRALYNVRSMDQALATSVAARRFAMTLISVFALVALALSALGIYGVVSYSVSQRTREIGVRVALGAQPADLIRWVLRQGLRIACLGLLIGLAGAGVIARLVASQLFRVNALDPLTLTLMASLLLLSALLACWLPARRATQIDPMEALRYE
jgi:putative ABC transport system permease protein